MKRRALYFALAAGFLGWGSGVRDVRAGLITLPTTLDTLTASPSNYAIVSNPAAGESMQFSGFDFNQVTGAPPAANEVNIGAFTLAPPPGETGLEFTGTFSAAAGVSNAWVIS